MLFRRRDVWQGGRRISQLRVDKQGVIRSEAAIFGTGRGITQQSAAKSDVHIPPVEGWEEVCVCVCYEIKFEVTREDLSCILSHERHH